MRVHAVDYGIILIYIVVMLSAGLIGSIKAKNREDYLVVGRNLPLPVYVACISTVVIGGGATFGAATQGFRHGISGAWMVTMFGVGILALGFLLSTKLSNLRILTISEMLSQRYSPFSGTVSAIISTFYTIMVAVTNAIALGVAFQAITGLSLGKSIFIAATVALCYTLLGGMISLAITDSIQFFLMTLTIFFILLPLGFNKVGGISGLTASVPKAYIDPLAVGGGRIFSWFILFALGLAIGQDIWQRVFAAKNAKTAKKGAIIGGIYTIIWSLAMTLSGMIAFVLAPNIDPQNALSEAVIAVVPLGIKGLVFAGIMSAFMSTIAGCTLASSTLLINDILGRRSSSLAQNRMVIVAVGVTIIFLSVKIQNVLTALDIAYAILSGCIFVPIIAGFFWKRANWQGAISSMIVSAAVVLTSMIFFGSSSIFPILFGIATSAMTLVIVSLITPAESPEKLSHWENSLSDK